MRAWTIHELGPYDEVMRLEEVDRQLTAGDDEVLIDVAACGLNFPDLLLASGDYQEKPDLPFTVGQEVTGTVAEVGDGVEGLEPGQRVVALPELGLGGLAERTRAKVTDVFAIPDWLEDEAGAGMFLVYQTAHVALHRRAAIQEGETLLVHGAAGGVGTATIQVGKAAGARVIAVAGGPEKVAVCRELGADEVIDHHQDDFVPVVKELTGGRGADVIFDPVGGDVYERSGKVIAFEGRLLVIGFASGTIPAPALGYPLVKNFSIVGVHWGLYRRRAPEVIRETHEALLELARSGAVAPHLHATLPLEDAVEGLRLIADREATGKVVVLVR